MPHIAVVHDNSGVASRFRVLEIIGSGAHGVVCKAVDNQTGGVVAIKKLRLQTTTDEQTLRQEFRRMADVSHPNLMLPLELLTADGETSLVMEYIDGVGLLEALRETPAPERFERLDALLVQLVASLDELHGRGLVHRDVKPANILVTRGGRLVLLDYGLMALVAQADASFLGTPVYIAPEVVVGFAATAAADWYAVGTMLYELLSGEAPYPRDTLSNMAAKSAGMPPPPLVDPTLPAELCALTLRLLAPDPALRAGRHDVLEYLGLGSRRDAVTRFHVAEPGGVVGRAAELAQLDAFLAETPLVSVVSLHGAPGMGKSTLVQAWLDLLAKRDSVWVLRGRCYERDATPYQAMDEVVIQIAAELERTRAPRPALSPVHSAALKRAFPTVADALGASVESAAATDDLVGARRAAYGALSEVVAALAGKRTVVIAIDDLQWGDADSAELLDALLSGSGVHRLAVIAYRTDERDTSAFLRAFMGRARAARAYREVAVGPLSAAAARQMVTAIAPALDAGEVDAILREAEGSAFLLEMGAMAAIAGAGQGAPSPHDYGAGRSPLEVDTLRLVSVAGRPLPVRVIATASAADAVTAPMTTLRGLRLVRTSGVGDALVIEVYHARIRASVQQSLSHETRGALNRRLAEALLANAADNELVARYFALSDVPERAATYAQEAAARAFEQLAFEHAATLYRLALDVSPPDEAQRIALRRRLARALEFAGRGRDAAQQWLACVDAGATDRLALMRLAADQLLVTGHLEAAIPIVRTLLREAGGTWPESNLRARWELLISYLRMLVARPRSTPWQGAPIDPAMRYRVELYGSLGRGLSSYDALRAPAFVFHCARLSLRHGHDALATLGMGYVAFVSGLSGKPKALEQADRWLSAARALAAARGDRHGIYFAEIVGGILDVCRLRWREAIVQLEDGIAGLQANVVGAQWEVATAKSTSLHAYFYIGDATALRVRASAYARDARGRGDLALETEARLYAAASLIAEDDVEALHEALAAAMAPWQSQEFQYPHWIAVRFGTYGQLRNGTVDALVVQTFERATKRARAAGLVSMQVVRVEIAMLGGMLGLAQGATRRAIRRVRRSIRALRKEVDCPVATALALLLEGRLVALQGAAQGEATRLVTEARERFVDCDMQAHAAALTMQLAAAARDEAGHNAALETLQRLGVRAPETYARLLVGPWASRGAGDS